ncbi:MAG TPA: tetratricopeptide repeat protein [Blastocatellia bacterium]|nr:tetratricopeptide repeat protein [Blastocatellia bacterium]
MTEQVNSSGTGCRASRLICCLLLAAFSLLVFSCRNRALLDQAQVAWDGEDFQTAADCYEKFLKENPASERAAYAHFQAGNIYLLKLKQYDRAVTHYVQLIEGFPRSPDLFQARQRLAKAYVAMGKRREAINELENLLIAFPDKADKRRTRLEIADLYFDQTDLSQALAEYQKVVKDSPYDPLAERAYLQIGGICVLRDDFEDATAAYQEVVRQTTDKEIRRQASIGLSDCYVRMLRFEDAVKILEQAEPDPKAPDDLRRRIASVRELQKQRGLQ